MTYYCGWCATSNRPKETVATMKLYRKNGKPFSHLGSLAPFTLEGGYAITICDDCGVPMQVGYDRYVIPLIDLRDVLYGETDLVEKRS